MKFDDYICSGKKISIDNSVETKWPEEDHVNWDKVFIDDKVLN